MVISEVHLTEQERTSLEAVARRTGRSPEELVHDALGHLLAQFEDQDRLSLLRQARGMWKNRTDLASVGELRREWERRTGFGNGD